ncbi:hypothetical protein ONA02_00535 [Mycoplasmopsis felis]|uniref:hypothetical protein n=1 Tax=Mycoplasmopsis felis TaxID=33923 RepID=UPI0022858C2F|nr:hypothetical protein [Mycoplasmopsis felis]WAM02372.1 hypothetical protein ONA02_00535 [Mycoplasmopsis felis]
MIINQSQYNQNNTYPIVDSNNLRFGFFDINIEIINNFNNERFFLKIMNSKIIKVIL